ncbi:MAG: GNAT family N-acetyltransferase [Caldilinea sp.]|jgi:GNAT superfamily N-acetyltransferase
MSVPIEFHEIDPCEGAPLAAVEAAIVDLWNEALAPDMAISNAFVRYNLRPSAGVRRRIFLACVDDAIIGVVLASALHGEPAVNPHGEGWIELLAVASAFQRKGVGRRLLNLAEQWLLAAGCRAAQIGGGLRPFAPGAPDTGVASFFQRHGYAVIDAVWDMAANLATYRSPGDLSQTPCAARPAVPGQEQMLLDFLRREFPGRWRYEAEMFLADGGRISDYMLLWTERGLDGCCLLTFPDSVRPIERFYPYRLPKPWGQIGSIGVSADRRGQGLGSALLDAGLRRLHDNGVNGCVIDWTTLLDFYGKFGFERYRAYVILGKALEPERCTDRS